MTKEEEKVLQKRKKQMLAIYKKSLTAISKINNDKIYIHCTFNFDEDCSIRWTVFDTNTDNCSFYFYSFRSLKEIEEKMQEVMSILKKHTFQEIKEFCCAKP